MDSNLAIEMVVRESYGRLLAYLSSRSLDFAAAEDALSDALLAGIKQWPIEGVPDNPFSWLLSVANRRLIDQTRKEVVRNRELEAVRGFLEDAYEASGKELAFPDERLKLMFVCTHPAIDPLIRTPLILQTVLGIEASKIAAAFLASPEAMSQRLVRAKGKIRAARIPFEVPEENEWHERIEFVLDAIYAAFTTGWQEGPDSEGAIRMLVPEAIMLARLLVELVPKEPEARGLLSLMLHIEARRAARFSPEGLFIPLLEQDPSCWEKHLIDEAESQLISASVVRRPGRFQLEAAIQSVHAARRFSASVRWDAILGIYEALIALSGNVGALVGRAAALAASGAATEALTALDELPEARIRNYQAYWATRGHVLQSCGRSDEAQVAWKRAIGLTEQPAVREYLIRKSKISLTPFA